MPRLCHQRKSTYVIRIVAYYINSSRRDLWSAYKALAQMVPVDGPGSQIVLRLSSVGTFLYSHPNARECSTSTVRREIRIETVLWCYYALTCCRSL